jgi:hypothetical protein
MRGSEIQDTEKDGGRGLSVSKGCEYRELRENALEKR